MSDTNDPWATPATGDSTPPQPPTNPYGTQPPTPSPYGQPPAPAPYGQPPAPAPYGQQAPQPSYGPPPGYGYAPIAPKHGSATTALVLGIIGLAGGLMLCGLPLVVSPFAWVIGGKAVKEIDASPQMFSGRDQAQAGRIMGIVGTVLLILAVLGIALLIGLGASGAFDEVTYESNV